MDADNPSAALQVASCTYRIALGPRMTESAEPANRGRLNSDVNDRFVKR